MMLIICLHLLLDLVYFENITLISNVLKVLRSLSIPKLLYGFVVLLVVERLIYLKSFVIPIILMILLSLIVIPIVGLLDILDKSVFYLMNLDDLLFLGKSYLSVLISMLLLLNRKVPPRVTLGFLILLYLRVLVLLMIVFHMSLLVKNNFGMV